MSNNWVRSLVFAAVGITVVLVILAVASVFAAPPTPNKIILLLNDTKATATAHIKKVAPYGNKPPPDWVNVIVACPTACKVSADTTNGNKRVVFSALAPGTYLIYTINGSWYALDADEGTTAATNTTQLYCANTAGCPDIYIYINTTDGGVIPFAASSLPEVGQWRSKILNSTRVWFVADAVPVTLNYTYWGATDSYSFTSNTVYEFIHVVPPQLELIVSGVAGSKNFTVPAGARYIIYASNLSLVELNAAETETGQENLTLEVYAYDEYSGRNVTGDVYVNGSLAGKTFEPLTVPNATLDVKIIASGYESKEFLTAPGRVIVYLKPYSQPSEKVNVTFTAYDAETGGAVDATFSEGFTSWHSGQRVQMTKGYHTVSVSASGYKPLRFTVFLSGDAEIPVYLVKAGSNANYSGGVGYNPAHANITNTNSPDPNVYTGCHVGFHIVNPSGEPAQVTIIGKTFGDAIITGYVPHVGVVDQFTVPPYSGTYKAYNLQDVAWRIGRLVMVTGCDINKASLYTFTIVANGKKVAIIKGTDAFNNYVDVYVASPGNASWTAGWGGWDNASSGGNDAMMKMLGQLMPLLIIVLVFGLISQALKRR